MSTYRNSTYDKRGYGSSSSSDGWLSLLLYYILPFIILNVILFFAITTPPKCTLSVADTNDYLSTEVTMTIDSWFPTKSFSLLIDSEEIKLEKQSGRSYKAIVTKNGTLEAHVVNINGMPLTIFEQIDILDDNPPEFTYSHIEDGLATLTFNDSQSGVNVDSIYALNSNGDVLSPLSLDRATATAVFEMDSAGIWVYCQDMAGQTVQGHFTSSKEGDTEVLHGGEVEETESSVTVEN